MGYYTSPTKLTTIHWINSIAVAVALALLIAHSYICQRKWATQEGSYTETQIPNNGRSKALPAI